MIAATCPVGLIGDDIQAVAAEAEQEYGIRCVAYSCEGYKGVSQSAGHHIANNGLMKRVIGTGDYEPATKYSINILGEYNIGGDGWEQERILKKIGYEVVSVFTGDGEVERIASSHKANLNLVQCHRSINYIAEMMKTKYGVDWLKVNFIGLEGTVQSLRDMACNALVQLMEPHKEQPKIKGVNILGDYNLAGEMWIIRNYLREMGIPIVATLTGDAAYETLIKAPAAQLNIVQCAGSMYRGKKYTGETAAALLLANQMAGLRALSQAGIVSKVNTVLLKGINDGHIPQVVETARELGAVMTNIMNGWGKHLGYSYGTRPFGL